MRVKIMELTSWLVMLLLLSLTTRAQTATHVNISIAQHAVTNPADVSYVDGMAPDELKAGPAKLRLAEDNTDIQSARLQYNQQQQRLNQQQFSRLRKAQAQQKQNQEFERYIQSYHSGPTVETVFETSSPAPARYQQESSVDAAPQRLMASPTHARQQLHTFERQVALPNAQTKPIVELSQETSAPATASATSVSGSASAATATAGSGLSSGYDQASYDPSNSYHNKHSYDQQNSYNYETPGELQHEYPPSVDEPSTGYYNTGSSLGEESHAPSGGYLPAQPAYARPMVRKTIQIAQPALKAKKYEIRHPAIQKEFYDIEERVVIKPAGTIVVELERPVSKIAKGEAILPLGIPHPAVAGAYNNNGLSVSQTQSSSVPHDYDYKPQAVLSGSTTAASAVTTTPTYDQSARSDFAEAKLRASSANQERAYNKEAQRQDDFFVLTDAHGNQRQVSANPGFRGAARVELQSNAEPSGASFNEQRAYAAPDNFKSDYYEPEFVEHSKQQQQDFKPARLQELPKEQTAPRVTTHIIKHEHNIHLPPSQHNIYLGRLQQKSPLAAVAPVRSSRYEEEAARVHELKPYYQRHKGSVAVYAASTVRPAPARYTHAHDNAEHVQYSAPYSNMRYTPQETARYTQEQHHQQQEPARHAHIQIQIPHQDEAGEKGIVVSSTLAPLAQTRKTASYRLPAVASSNAPDSEVETFSAGRARYGQLQASPADCDKPSAHQQHFSRLVELPASDAKVTPTPGVSATPPTVAELAAARSVPAENVDINVKSTNGHVSGGGGGGGSGGSGSGGSGSGSSNTAGGRVIAATPAPTDASASSESFHKRRIVVNHPFQTVREVVEHEPITNYHHVQVNEHALAPYYQMHDALRQLDEAHLPSIVYPSHGQLHYGYH